METNGSIKETPSTNLAKPRLYGGIGPSIMRISIALISEN